MGSGTEESAAAAMTLKKSGHKFESFYEKTLHGYTGLINQGATCYLNSLLQAIFMLPEFRLALYTSQEDDSSTISATLQCELISSNSKCVCNVKANVAALFARLQLTHRGALPTNELSASFGWTERDSFAQQDVQECMAVSS